MDCDRVQWVWMSSIIGRNANLQVEKMVCDCSAVESSGGLKSGGDLDGIV